MKDGTDQARAFAVTEAARRGLGPVRHDLDRRPEADGPGVPRGRTQGESEGDGGGPRQLSHDGTKPIGGRRKHA